MYKLNLFYTSYGLNDFETLKCCLIFSSNIFLDILGKEYFLWMKLYKNLVTFDQNVLGNFSQISHHGISGNLSIIINKISLIPSFTSMIHVYFKNCTIFACFLIFLGEGVYSSCVFEGRGFKANSSGDIYINCIYIVFELKTFLQLIKNKSFICS